MAEPATVHRERTSTPAHTICYGCKRELSVYYGTTPPVTCCGYMYTLEVEVYLVVGRERA